jgi:hypothetical protein
LIAFFVVASIGVITGRELECFYLSDETTLWPEFHYCSLSRVDLSESFQSQLHSFTGSTSQKSEATAVWFDYSSKIDFIPKEILKEFPNLNGLLFKFSNLPVVKNDLFPPEFVVLEYFGLGWSQIVSIEPFAFKNLKNLKWFQLAGNKIQSLPFNLFQNNPKLIYLEFDENQINSISPNLLKNLNKLKVVNFYRNQCVNKRFGCDWCSPISELDSGLSTCFQNCLKDPECATKSELVEGTTETEKERDPIQTTPQVTTNEYLPAQNKATANNPNPTLQSLQTNLTQELAKNISEKLKSTEEKLEAKTATLNQAFEVQQENLASLNQSVASEVAAIKKTFADFRKLVRKSEDTCKAETEEVKKIAKQEADAVRSLVDFQLEQFNRTIGEFEAKSEEMAENFEKTKQNLIDANGKTIQDFKEEMAENTTKTLLASDEQLEKRVEKIVENLSLKLDREKEDRESKQEKNLSSLKQSLASEVTKAVSTHVEKMEMKVEILSLKFSEAKSLLNLERKDRELIQSKCANDKLARDFEIAELKQEINDLKKESQDQENALKLEFDEIISQKLAEFEFKHKNEART